MNDKIEEYRRRRAKRLQKRLDAKDDNDEGRWVTTENDNRVHLNKNGVPDKGNPFVLSAMTGKKPKLSMNYHQKNVAKAAKSGNATDVLDELLKIPNGSKVLINGEKYKANFGDDESGRWIDFVNTEDEDDVLSTFEVAMAIQENGDVSLEAPDRKEKESEPTYEPDVEPENEEYFPDDDIEMPDSPEGYGEVAPQEEPDDVPDEVAPQENPDDLPTGIAPQDAGALAPSAMAGELKTIIKNQVSDDISDADFVAGYEEAISQLEGMADGTQIKVGNKTYTKTNDLDYPFVLETTGQTVSADTVYNSLETAATIDDDFEMEVVEPEEKETGESNPVSENKKQAYELLKSIMGLKYGDLENGEWDSAYDKAKEIIEGIPEGTEISVGGHKLQKYDDSVFPLVNAETGELHSVGDLSNFLNEENNEGVVIGSQEEAPQEQAVVQNDPVSAREKILDLMADAEAGNFVPDNEWIQAFNNLPEGTTLTNKFGSEFTLAKDENGKAKFMNPNGVQLKNHKIIEYLRDKSYGYKVNVPEETATQEHSTEVFTPSSGHTMKDFLDQAHKIQKKKDMLTSEEWENYSGQVLAPVIGMLDDVPAGSKISIGDESYTKISNGTWKIDKSPWGFKDSASHMAQLIAKHGVNSFEAGSPGTTGYQETNNTVGNANAYSGVKVNGSGQIQELKSDIDDFIKKSVDGEYASSLDVGYKFTKLEDGSTIKLGNKIYTKGTDSYGDAEFKAKNSYGYDDVLSGIGIANQIAQKAKQFGNDLKLEISEPSEEWKQQQAAEIAAKGTYEEQNNYENTDPEYTSNVVNTASQTADVTFSPSDFTQTKKDKAVWDKGKGTKIDKLLRPVTGEVWKTLNDDSKQALWSYTDGSYDSMNSTLRDGKDHGSYQPEIDKKIEEVTAAIDQCSAPKDVWLQRGCSYHSLGKLFGVSPKTMDSLSGQGAKVLLETLQSSANYGQDKAFMSCGSAKGKGFSGKQVIMNIYCPKGTKMMYAEPFSDYGASHAYTGWDGESGQSSFSHEHETILQRGTMLVPRKVSMKGGKIYVDVDVVGQEYK